MQNSKNSILPDNAPVEFMGAKRTEIPLPMMGVGREYAELKNSFFPDGALHNVGTPKRSDIVHGSCVPGGKKRN